MILIGVTTNTCTRIFINPDNIECVIPSFNEDKGATIAMMNGTQFYVNETPKEIIKLIDRLKYVEREKKGP